MKLKVPIWEAEEGADRAVVPWDFRETAAALLTVESVVARSHECAPMRLSA